MQGETIQEETKEKTAEKKHVFAKYTVKDSVFTTIFRDKKYLIQLYRALHPEDTETTEEALTDITIRNVLTNGIYNDLGFRIGDKILFLVEQQSLWTMNIIVRALMYLVQNYHDYFGEQNADLFGSKKVHVPKPELYMIYTGERVNRPETILLSKEFFAGKECAIEVKVKVLYGGKGNDIISQYVAFTKVYNDQVKQYGRSRKAVTETIRICQDRDVLREFLASREKEVISIMMALFDEEKIMRTHIASERREAARETAEKMLRAGKITVDEIAEYFTDLSTEDIQEIEKGLLQTI